MKLQNIQGFALLANINLNVRDPRKRGLNDKAGPKSGELKSKVQQWKPGIKNICTFALSGTLIQTILKAQNYSITNTLNFLVALNSKNLKRKCRSMLLIPN